MIFACQRLLPLGQNQAGKILWRLKPVLLEIAGRSEVAACHPEDITVFMPLPELGSMRHPILPTRLFIS
jgi:urease accessory protein